MSALEALTRPRSSKQKSFPDGPNTSPGSSPRSQRSAKSEERLPELRTKLRLKADHRTPSTEHIMPTPEPTNVWRRTRFTSPLSPLKTLIDTLGPPRLCRNRLSLQPLLRSLIVVIHELTKIGSSASTRADMEKICTESS